MKVAVFGARLWSIVATAIPAVGTNTPVYCVELHYKPIVLKHF
jgi:hypothetical protein